MDVMSVLVYRLPAKTRAVIDDYVKKHRTGITAGEEWEAMDAWFWQMGYAKRHETGAPIWIFPNKEKYTEFCLKWM